MITEFRRIVFSNKHVDKAIQLAKSRTGLDIYSCPQGKMSHVSLTEDALILYYAHQSTGNEESHNVPTLHAAAMLILYCGHVNVPVPREAQKYLSQVGEHVALDMYIKGGEKPLSYDEVSEGIPISPYALDEALAEASERMMEAMMSEA